MYANLFNKGGLSLDRLKALVEVADAGGIARAVGTDPVRQSQYSRQLKELEDFFETELTKREGKSLVLTQSGLWLAQLARENLKGLDDFWSDCRKKPVTISIGAGDSLIRWLILPMMGGLRTMLPDAVFNLRNLRTARIVQQIGDLALDFGVIRKDAVGSGLKSVSLGMLDYALFVPKRLLGNPKTTCEWILGHVPIVSLEGKGEYVQKLAETAQKKRIRLNIRLECDSFPAACEAVATGQYAGVLPKLAASELSQADCVCMESAIFRNQARPIALVWNPRIIRLRPQMEKIRRWLGEELSVNQQKRL